MFSVRPSEWSFLAKLRQNAARLVSGGREGGEPVVPAAVRTEVVRAEPTGVAPDRYGSVLAPAERPVPQEAIPVSEVRPPFVFAAEPPAGAPPAPRVNRADPLFNAQLQEAAAYGGDPTVASAAQARVALARYLQATGQPWAAARVRASLGALEDLTQSWPLAAKRLLPGLREHNAQESRLAEAIEAGLTDFRAPRRTPGPGRVGGSSTHMFHAMAGDTPVLLRAVKESKVGVNGAAAERSHNAVNILAHQLGAPDFTLPTVLIPTPEALRSQVGGAKTMMVVPYVGMEYAPAGRFTGQLDEAGKLVSEDDRITGAVLSYLTRHNDARPNNTLVNAQGDAWFIDHDNTFGRLVDHARNGFIHNDYFKGRELAYSSDLSTYAALPERVRVVIDGLCAMNTRQASEMYHLPYEEAATLLEQARNIKAYGLEGAIERFPIPQRWR